MKNIAILSSLVLLCSSCFLVVDPPQYNDRFPETPVNLEEVNSPYDDYNSTAPKITNFHLCFSSNRKRGTDYDIVYTKCTIEFDETSGKPSISVIAASPRDSENANIITILRKINTRYDEFGPYIMSNGENEIGMSYVFMYSNNESGNQDILFTANTSDGSVEIPRKVDFLNSEYDDAYPAFNGNFSEIYFTSNRGTLKHYDIYKVNTSNAKTIIDKLVGSSGLAVVKDTVLSSNFDDKCPFITKNFMVFTSNRDGGYGGYDLYFSKFENGTWSTPQNFGNKINTEFDEFRPITISPINNTYYDPFSSTLMVFSSNRPGGKGGFDLYYVGIDKIRTLPE